MHRGAFLHAHVPMSEGSGGTDGDTMAADDAGSFSGCYSASGPSCSMILAGQVSTQIPQRVHVVSLTTNSGMTVISFCGCIHFLTEAVRGLAVYAEIPKNRFCLVLMNVHVKSP
jgi:hypothetical protein